MLLFLAGTAFAAAHEVAITIDDLPRGGDGPRSYTEVRALTQKLLAPIRQQKIPVTAFVITDHGAEMGERRFREILNLPTPQIKAELQAFLKSHDYRVAPVTFDDSDYEYALLYTHGEYRDRVGAEYVPYMELEHALADPAYQLPEEYAGLGEENEGRGGTRSTQMGRGRLESSRPLKSIGRNSRAAARLLPRQ